MASGGDNLYAWYVIVSQKRSTALSLSLSHDHGQTFPNNLYVTFQIYLSNSLTVVTVLEHLAIKGFLDMRQTRNKRVLRET